MKFQLSPQAQEALDQLRDYYFDRGGTRLASRILGEIHDAIYRLIEFPGLGHLRPDLTDKPLRFFASTASSSFTILRPSRYISRVFIMARATSNVSWFTKETHDPPN